MKPLVAFACVAVIAAVSYYFWGEFQTARLTAERQESANGAKAELFDLASAKPDEISKVRDWCRTWVSRSNSADLKDNEMAQQVARNCRVLGYLN